MARAFQKAETCLGAPMAFPGRTDGTQPGSSAYDAAKPKPKPYSTAEAGLTPGGRRRAGLAWACGMGASSSITRGDPGPHPLQSPGRTKQICFKAGLGSVWHPFNSGTGKAQRKEPPKGSEPRGRPSLRPAKVRFVL